MEILTLKDLSLLLGILVAAYTLLTALIALVTSYVMVKARLKQLEEDKRDIKTSIEKLANTNKEAIEKLDSFFRGVLFQPDGQTNLMPRSACADAREGCQNTIKDGFADLKADLAAMDKKREDSKSALLGLFTKVSQDLLKHQAWHEAHAEKGAENGNAG